MLQDVQRPAPMAGEDTTADVRERVLTVLTAIEWAAQVDHPDGGWYACCPWCEGGDPDDDETPPGRAGHAELCELAAVLALLRTPRGEGERGLIMRAMLETFPWSPDIRQEHFERAADAVLAALRSEAQGEEDAVLRTWKLAVQRAYGCLDYCGGYRGAELEAFHSGIKTVIRALEAGPDTVDTQTAALDRIGAARRGEGGADGPTWLDAALYQAYPGLREREISARRGEGGE